MIKAAYPWYDTYFYHDITALTPNPHRIIIEDNQTNYEESGTIVYSDSKTKTIGILCSNNKVIKMTDVNLYKKCDRPFTKNYIAREINIGDIII